mmetsp:Transcript_31919/g.50923  ORF Transcript_31919/g.50923 Transcript_31919/m.50923 type:complete len:168 (-) Transcript_31919:18-521(-)
MRQTSVECQSTTLPTSTKHEILPLTFESPYIRTVADGQSTTMIVKPRPKYTFCLDHNGHRYYYCKGCSRYKLAIAFYPSYIKRQYRKCKLCLKKKEARKPPLNKLHRKLYKSLWTRGEKGIAQLLTPKAIHSLLELRGVAVETVKKLKAPVEPRLLYNLINYKIITN